jgi:hypothetical protein
MTSSARAVAMERPEWRWESVGIDDPASFARARELAINVTQWVARIANSYVPAATADDRVRLTFRAPDAAFVTQPFEDDKSLEMRLPRLELQFLEAGRPVPHILDTEDHSPAETEAWLLVELLHRGIDRDKFSKALPYAVAGLMTGDAEKYAPERCRQGLDELTAWFRNGAAVLKAATATASLNEAAIPCWPQTLILAVATSRGELGFSPGEARDMEPYFYARPASGEDRFVLTVSQLMKESDPMAAAVAFMKTAIN